MIELLASGTAHDDKATQKSSGTNYDKRVSPPHLEKQESNPRPCPDHWAFVVKTGFFHTKAELEFRKLEMIPEPSSKRMDLSYRLLESICSLRLLYHQRIFVISGCQ